MAIPVSRLRRWFAAGAVLVVIVVVGAYYIAKWRIENALTKVPGKINVQIQQSAEGFTISKSEGGRTIFKVQAGKLVQYKAGGKAELRDVAIVLYGKDSSRYDQIYGSDFEYDQQSGEVVARGDVQIDLEANPEGIRNPDQTLPRELKNPIHLRTRGLVFNTKTGDGYTPEKVEFRVPQAQGTAVGASYQGKENVLVLESEVQIEIHGPNPATLRAGHGVIRKEPHTIVLSGPRLESKSQTCSADGATVFLRPDNTVDRMEAAGNVQVDSRGASSARARAEKAEVFMAAKGDTLRSAVFSGDVQMETGGEQAGHGTAGSARLNFSGKNVLSSVHTEGGVKLVQRQKSSGNAGAQDVEITAPAVEFVLAKNHLQRAITAGPPQIALRPTGTNGSRQQTVITADRFEAKFSAAGKLASVHGAAHARMTTLTPDQPDRVSTSDVVDAAFKPDKGIESLVQQGNFAYTDGERRAWGARAAYTPSDQMVVLTGSPRFVDSGTTTTADTMRLNRSSGDAFAEGNVKSTYSDLKAQPNGGMLASSSPIHVTAQAMVARKASATAVYSGNARLWQEANVVQAPVIQFDRDQRTVVARGSAGEPVSSILMQSEKGGSPVPATIVSSRLTYSDKERKAHFDGAVTGKWTDMTITANQMDVFLQPKGESSGGGQASPGKLDRVVAQGQVVIVQPKRRGTGEELVYTAADDKFVLTGGPPSIFDAEQGKITGVSLTLFRHDDRVLVEGNAASPVVTQTRVAR
ncbi:MAG TPA: LPS export ABC transporter periplasmic protein LptC [Terriglobales bacterium]